MIHSWTTRHQTSRTARPGRGAALESPAKFPLHWSIWTRLTLLRAHFWDDPFLDNSTPNLTHSKTGARSSTRIPCEIPVTLVNLDPLHPFSESCQILLVNLKGCAVRSTRPVKIGAEVELQGLP